MPGTNLLGECSSAQLSDMFDTVRVIANGNVTQAGGPCPTVSDMSYDYSANYSLDFTWNRVDAVGTCADVDILENTGKFRVCQICCTGFSSFQASFEDSTGSGTYSCNVTGPVGAWVNSHSGPVTITDAIVTIANDITPGFIRVGFDVTIVASFCSAGPHVFIGDTPFLAVGTPFVLVPTASLIGTHNIESEDFHVGNGCGTGGFPTEPSETRTSTDSITIIISKNALP